MTNPAPQIIEYKKDMYGTHWSYWDNGDVRWAGKGMVDLEAWLLEHTPAYVETVEQQKAIMKERIIKERKLRTQYEFQMGDHWYQAADNNKHDLSGIIHRYSMAIEDGETIPPGTFGTWETVDGAEVEIDRTFAKNLLDAIINHVGTCEQVKRFHMANMLAAEIPADYNYMTGWPARYEGTL